MAAGDEAVVGAGLGDVFRDDGFLRIHGLSVENVVDYFGLSPFHRAREASQIPGRQYIGEGTKSPELLLIKEQVAKAGGVPGDVETTAVWYCLNGSILACPDLHTLIASRLRRVSASMRECVRLLGEDRGHSVFGGGYWKHIEEAATRQEAEAVTHNKVLEDPVQGRKDDASLLDSQPAQVDSVVAFVGRVLAPGQEGEEDVVLADVA